MVSLVPFVQLFLPPAGPEDGPGQGLGPGEAAAALAAALSIDPRQVLVQEFIAEQGSSAMAVAVLRGRRRPGQELARAALARLLAARLGLPPEAVSVTWQAP